MTMAQAIRTCIRSAPFDFDFRKLNIEAAQRRVGDILGTLRISNPKGVTTDRDTAAHKRHGCSSPSKQTFVSASSTSAEILSRPSPAIRVGRSLMLNANR